MAVYSIYTRAHTRQPADEDEGGEEAVDGHGHRDRHPVGRRQRRRLPAGAAAPSEAARALASFSLALVLVESGKVVSERGRRRRLPGRRPSVNARNREAAQALADFVCIHIGIGIEEQKRHRGGARLQTLPNAAVTTTTAAITAAARPRAPRRCCSPCLTARDVRRGGGSCAVRARPQTKLTTGKSGGDEEHSHCCARAPHADARAASASVLVRPFESKTGASARCARRTMRSAPCADARIVQGCMHMMHPSHAARAGEAGGGGGGGG